MSEDPIDFLSTLKAVRRIAVVGISDKPERSSYSVAEYLSRYYEIVPVNPYIAEWKGIKAYSSISNIPQNISIDLVDVFRRSEEVLELVKDAFSHPEISCIWMQQGVIDEEAKKLAVSKGIIVVMDSCLAVVHSQLKSEL